jgi:hypothetical protein
MLTRTQRKSITSTQTLGLITVTRTTTISAAVTSTIKASTTKPNLATTTKKARDLVPELDGRAVTKRCAACPKNTILTKTGSLVKSSTCCEPRKTTTITKKSTKVVTTSLKTRRTTTIVVTATKPISTKKTTVKSTSKTTAKTTAKSSAKSSKSSSTTRSTGIVSERTVYRKLTDPLITTTITRSGDTIVKVTTATPTSKPLVLGHYTKPNNVECQLTPAPGFVKVVYANGVTVSPAIYVPKSSDASVCDLTTKARAIQPISVTFASSLFGSQVDWILSGKVQITTYRSALGMGMVKFVAKDETSGNFTNSISFPATSFTKPISPKESTAVSNPTVKEIVKHIDVQYDWTSTGQVLTLDKLPSSLWKLVGVNGPLTQLNLNNWIVDTMKLTDKPSFANGLTAFNMAFHASKTKPFQATLTLHQLLSNLGNSFVLASVSGTILGKPGAWTSNKLQPRFVGLRPAQDSIYIEVPGKNLQDLCRIKTPYKAQGHVKFVPRVQNATSHIDASLTKLVCKQNVVTSWEASWNMVSSHIDLTPPDFASVVNDTNAVQSGKVSFNSVTGLYTLEGIVGGLAVTIAHTRNATRTSANLKKPGSYYGIHWAFTVILDLSKAEPVNSIKLWIHSFNKTQSGGNPHPWVSLASPKDKVCYQLHHVIPCIPPTTKNAAPVHVWPLHSTGAYIAKTSPKQGFEALAQALVANFSILWVPKTLMFNGHTELTPNVYPTLVNLTIPLANKKPGTAKLGLNITLTHGIRPIGAVSALLTKWPCNNVHQGHFNLTQLLPRVMTLDQANKTALVTILDSKSFTGPSNLTFTCTPQGDIENVNVVGHVPDWTASLFDDAVAVTLTRGRLHLADGYSRLEASHSKTNRNITFYIPTRKTRAKYLAEPKPVWQFEGLNSAGEVNQTLVDFLGTKSAKQFRQFFDNSTSRLIRHTWVRPGASNITVGFSRDGNHTMHDLIFFGNTRHDPLVGKTVWKHQQLSKMRNVRAWSLPPAGRRWVDPDKYPGVIPTPSGSPIKYQTQLAGNLTGQTVSLPKKAQPTPVLQKRQDSSTSQTFTIGNVTTTTYAVPTFINVVSSNLTDGNNVLEVASSSFAYEWVLGNGNITALFAGIEVCPPQLQQVTMSGNISTFGNLTGFAGTGTFICSGSGNDSEPVSFAAQTGKMETTIQPLVTSIDLVNATMQVNCVPDSNMCFWPSVLIGGPLYGFTNALNGSSYWDSLNTTQLLINARANASYAGAQQEMLVQRLLANNSVWVQALQQVSTINIPSFLLKDPFALSLLTEDLYNVPVASFQCDTRVQYTCDTPSVVVSGKLKTVQPQTGSILMYGSIFSTPAGGVLLDRQTVAAQFGVFGSFAVNHTLDVCFGPITGVSYLINNITNNVQTGTNGIVDFVCDVQANIQTWLFTVPVGNTTTSAILGGSPTSFSLQNAAIVYYAVTDFLGTQATYNGVNHLVAVQPTVYINHTILAASSIYPSSLSMVSNATSPFQSFWQGIYGAIPSSYSSFNLTTVANQFSVTYNGTATNATLAFDVDFAEVLLGGIFIQSKTSVKLAQSSFSSPWQVVNDNSTLVIAFGGWNSSNFVELNVDQVPCTANGKGATNVTGLVDLALPGLIGGNLVGNVSVDFICAPFNQSNQILNQTLTNQTSTNQTWSDVNIRGNIQGPLSFDLLGGTLVVDSAFVSYDTASGMFNIDLSFENAEIRVSYDFAGNNSYLNNLYIRVPGPISPFNTSMPFSDLWVAALGQDEVNELTKEILLDQVLIDYIYGPPTNTTGDSFILQGGLQYGSVDVSVYLSLQQVTPQNASQWFVKAADLHLVIDNQVIVSIDGSSPCRVGVDSANVTLQNFGPFVKPASFVGNVILSCDKKNSIADFYFNASASGIPITVLGSTELLSANIAFDTSTKILLLNGGPSNKAWSLNFMMDFSSNSNSTNSTLTNSTLTNSTLISSNSTTNSSGSTRDWSICVGSNQPLSWSEIPFSDGMNVAFGQTGNAQLSNVSGVSLQSFSFSYTSEPEEIKLSASIGEGGQGFSAGQGLIIDVAKVNGTWKLLEAEFVFDTVFTIGDIGVVTLNGTLGCPGGNVTGLASLGGVPAMEMTIKAQASVNYVCHEWFDLSIAMSNLSIAVGQETLQLSQVGVTYSSLTNLLNVQGNMFVQSSVASGWATVNIVIQVVGSQHSNFTGNPTSNSTASSNSTAPSKTGLVSITVDLGVGSSTTLYDSRLPLSTVLNRAVANTKTQPVTPDAILFNLQYTYYAPNDQNLASMDFNAYLQDGSFYGSFFMELDQVVELVGGVNATNKTSWEASLVQVDVTLANYGTISIFGTDPCPHGQLNATANLTIPNVGNQVIVGVAYFVCNSTNSIMHWNLEATDTWTVSILGDTEVFTGTVLYDSQFKSLGFSASWNNVADILFNYNATTVTGNTTTNASFWDLRMQVLSPVGFGSLPFTKGMNGALTQSGASLTSPPSTGFDISSGLIDFTDNANDTLLFQVSIGGQDSSVTGSTSATVELVRHAGNWTVAELDISASIEIDNIAILTLDFEPLCPQVKATGSLLLTNLPLSIPTFGLNASVQFGCGPNGVNTSIYTITATLDEPTKLNFLGEEISINGMTLSYNSTQGYFVFNWVPVPGFTITLKFGSGLKTGQKQATGPPFILTAIYSPKTTPPGALTQIGAVVPSFGSSLDTKSFTNPAASAGESAISTDVNEVELNFLYIEFDAIGEAIYLSCDVQFYNVSADFIAIAKKTSGGSWEGFIGIQTQLSFQLSSSYGWLNSLVGSGSTQEYAQVNFFLATSAGSFALDGQTFTFMGAGLLLSALVDVSKGPVNQITGGANNTSPSTAQGGAFGVALASTSQPYNSPHSSFGLTPQPGAYLQVTLELSSKWAYLMVDLSADVVSSSNQQTVATTYTQLRFMIMCELTGVELTFEFDTTYITTIGGTQLQFTGGIGITFGDLGASVVVMFYFNGGWNDPLGLSPFLTVSYIAMQISIDLEDGIPDGVDLATQIIMVDPVTVSTAVINADLYLDLESPLQNSAVQFSITNFSLATIINLFWQSVPGWFEQMLESFSIGSLVVSFNPSGSPTGFPNPLVNIPSTVVAPGLIINATDINIFDFIYIVAADLDATSTGLYANVQIAPINYSPLFALTAMNNKSQGAGGSLTINSQEFAFNLNGEIELFFVERGAIADIFVEWGTGKTKSFFEAEWQYYDDYQTTWLIEETGEPSFGFGIAWNLYTTNSEGFFAAIFQGWAQSLNGIMGNTQSSVINAVNAQCASAIANVNRQLANAERQLQIAQAKADAAINNAEAKVQQAQDAVNNMQNTCQNYHHHCGWQFWNCIAYGFCEMGKLLLWSKDV